MLGFLHHILDRLGALGFGQLMKKVLTKEGKIVDLITH